VDILGFRKEESVNFRLRGIHSLSDVTPESAEVAVIEIIRKISKLGRERKHTYESLVRGQNHTHLPPSAVQVAGGAVQRCGSGLLDCVLKLAESVETPLYAIQPPRPCRGTGCSFGFVETALCEPQRNDREKRSNDLSPAPDLVEQVVRSSDRRNRLGTDWAPVDGWEHESE